jgi:hypothetical protein
LQLKSEIKIMRVNVYVKLGPECKDLPLAELHNSIRALRKDAGSTLFGGGDIIGRRRVAGL